MVVLPLSGLASSFGSSSAASASALGAGESGSRPLGTPTGSASVNCGYVSGASAGRVSTRKYATMATTTATAAMTSVNGKYPVAVAAARSSGLSCDASLSAPGWGLVLVATKRDYLYSMSRPNQQAQGDAVEFDVTIEIPKGNRNKYEVDHE